MSVRDKWEDYLRTFPDRDEKFVSRLYTTGALPPDLAEELRDAITSADPLPIANETYGEVAAAALNQKTLDKLNAQHVYRAFDRPTSLALRCALVYLKRPIAGLLHSPWRVLNCRSWTTIAGAEEYGPNMWHQDGDIKELLKIMIYSSETGGACGGLEIKAADGVRSIGGAPGQWVLFYNSRITHRGVAPKKSGFMRVATEVTIAPSREYDLEPRFLGQIARYPLHP
jgi:hypothetical protein